MTIWGPTENVGAAIRLGRMLSANVSLLFRHGLSGDGAQPRRASRGTDRRHHTEVNRFEKEVWQYWPHSLRLIARKQPGFRNLFFGSVANLHYSGAKGF
jgi:hypothetical protein